jgi:2-polyprenyl-3-methyl-5-hydroxy-6-metoxy-1,4-benzoquinol methylase
MSRRARTLAPDYFEALYAQDGDPWKFASSEYEAEKYARTLAALPEARYGAALEIGCSIGVLTRQLATRCERLVAIDAAPTPLAEARRRCQGLANVEFAQMFVPGEWPQGVFDLILLSEVIYYLDAADVAKLAKRVEAALAARGTVVLVHWTGETDYPLTGDQAAESFMQALQDRIEVVGFARRPEYRLDVLMRR